jgi:hypothetical protein
MRRFHRICEGLNVAPAMNQIEAHPELWGQHKQRTYEGGAFSECPDIWVRYRDPAELKSPADYLAPHAAIFYPSWDILTELHQLVFAMMYLVHGIYLGGILITKKPPGAVIKEHSDIGSWHAETMDAKAFITLNGGDGCTFQCDGDRQDFSLGEAWTFNNLLPHSVENKSDEETVTLIVSMRSATGNYLNMK